jgi:hypothetical protein
MNLQILRQQYICQFHLCTIFVHDQVLEFGHYTKLHAHQLSPLWEFHQFPFFVSRQILNDELMGLEPLQELLGVVFVVELQLLAVVLGVI